MLPNIENIASSWIRGHRNLTRDLYNSLEWPFFLTYFTDPCPLYGGSKKSCCFFFGSTLCILFNFFLIAQIYFCTATNSYQATCLLPWKQAFYTQQVQTMSLYLAHAQILWDARAFEFETLFSLMFYVLGAWNSDLVFDPLSVLSGKLWQNFPVLSNLSFEGSNICTSTSLTTLILSILVFRTHFRNNISFISRLNKTKYRTEITQSAISGQCRSSGPISAMDVF